MAELLLAMAHGLVGIRLLALVGMVYLKLIWFSKLNGDDKKKWTAHSHIKSKLFQDFILVSASALN